MVPRRRQIPRKWLSKRTAVIPGLRCSAGRGGSLNRDQVEHLGPVRDAADAARQVGLIPGTVEEQDRDRNLDGSKGDVQLVLDQDVETELADNAWFILGRRLPIPVDQLLEQLQHPGLLRSRRV